MAYKDPNDPRMIVALKKARHKWAVSDKGKAYYRAYYEKNKEKLNERRKKWREENPLSIKATTIKRAHKQSEYGKKYYQNNKKRFSEWGKNWNEFHPKKRKQISTKSYYKRKEQLSTSYIKELLRHKTDLKSADIPQELVELYKLKLIAERMVRNGTNQTTNNGRNENNS